LDIKSRLKDSRRYNRDRRADLNAKMTDTPGGGSVNGLPFIYIQTRHLTNKIHDLSCAYIEKKIKREYKPRDLVNAKVATMIV
jgi:hypothetical protein